MLCSEHWTCIMYHALSLWFWCCQGDQRSAWWFGPQMPVRNKQCGLHLLQWWISISVLALQPTAGHLLHLLHFWFSKHRHTCAQMACNICSSIAKRPAKLGWQKRPNMNIIVYNNITQLLMNMYVVKYYIRYIYGIFYILLVVLKFVYFCA